jgi:hypothetical protein
MSALLSETYALLTFCTSITEQPYKIPFYAALLFYLSIPASEDPAAGRENGSASAEKPSIGRLILDDFWKGFQAYLDKLAWRETRLCVRVKASILPNYLANGFRRIDPLLRASDSYESDLTSIYARASTVIHCSPR